MRPFSWLAVTVAAAVAAACSSNSVQTSPGDGGTACTLEDALAAKKGAIDLFWSIYHGNDYMRIAEAQGAIQAAIAKNPDDAELRGLLAATHFWHAGESGRDPHPDIQVLKGDLPAAVQLFEQAAAQDPNDDHLTGFVGVTSVHLGVAAGDAKMTADGDHWLQFGVYQFPEFNGFNLWAAYNQDSRDSATFARGLEGLWTALNACVGGTLDRKNPDITPYLSLEGTSTGRKKVCWDNELAPHGLEGFFLNFGNGLIKQGDTATGRIMYENARRAKNYASWPYRDHLESILASDLSARAALYANADPNDDPPMTAPGSTCTYCHATAAPR